MTENRARIPELTADEILRIFQEVNGYIEGHFVLTSALHSEVYFNKDAIYPHTTIISRICREIARRYRELDINIVVGPALGGIVLTQWTAHHLSIMTGRKVLAAYTEKINEEQVLTRGYDRLVQGKRTLCVEDVINTGGSITKVRDSLLRASADLQAVCSIMNRNPSGFTSDVLGFPLDSLLQIEIASYDPNECPSCKSGIPIDRTIGKGKMFL